MTLPPIQLKKSDKITMAIIGLLSVAAFGVIGVMVLPMLIAAATNTLYLLMEIAGLILLTSPIWDTNTRTALIYGWQNFSRNLRRTVARENPIGVMDTAISRFERKLEDIGTNLAKAVGAYKLQSHNITDFQAKAANEDELAQAAKKMGKPDTEIARHSRQALKWDEAADALGPVAANLKDLCDKMTSAREVCIDKLETMKGDREVFKARYDAMMAGQKALNSFKRFFGSSVELDQLRMSVEEVDKQTAESEAEIDQFLQDIKPMVDAGELQKQADTQRAMERVNGSKLLAATPIVDVAVVTPQRQLVGK